MQIDTIELFHLALPLRQPLLQAGRAMEKLETVLVRMRGGSESGWGEASPGNAPLRGADWAAGTFAMLRDWFAPRVAGTMVDTSDALDERLDAFCGHRYAKAALDMAWWDLHARRQQKPLHALLDGRRDRITIGTTLDRMDSVEEFLETLGQRFEAGYARAKLMLRPGWDLPMIDAVRKEFATETIHIDCDGALSLQQMDMLCRFDDFFLAMIEQPLTAIDLVGHAMVQETVKTPLGLSQSITCPAQADIAMELKSGQFINLEPGRVGGLTSALAIHDGCHEECLACFVGAVPQTGVAARAALALAAKANCEFPADFWSTAEMLEEDVCEPLVPTRGGEANTLGIDLWSEPGIGAEPEMATIEKYCIARAEVK